MLRRLAWWGLLVGLVVGVPVGGTTAWAAARPAAKASATLLGPLLARGESSTRSLARDGGVSVPLPDGRDLFIFADSPQYEFQHGKWNLSNFIHGSSAAVVSFTPGHRPSARLQEVVVGHAQSANNQPAQFLPSPHTYLPDGSRRLCNRANGGPHAYAARWTNGAALLPDKTHVFISYLDVCVTSTSAFRVEGWGFTQYNWKINKFDVGATDVFVPATSGAAISTSRYMGSPVVANNKVTLFSATCCSPGSVYTTTVAANTGAFRKPGSYVRHPVATLPATFWLSVAPPSRALPFYTMYWANRTWGEYLIFTATNPSGPWSEEATATLPRCKTSPVACATIYIHPELSTSSQLLVSYYLPDYGPGIATHPDPHPPLGHLVWASIPLRF